MSLLDDIAAALDLPPSSLPLSPDGGGGGSGFASTGVAKDSSGRRYFYKKGSGASDAAMLNAEYEGVKEMHGTNTIHVPEPLAFGSIEDYPKSGPFVVFEHLRIGGGGDGAEMGRKLAAMHRVESPDGRFGFRIDNTIGATPQRNTWEETWADFFIKHRFYAMLQKCSNLNFETSELREIEEVIRAELEARPVPPSLLHGDLWGGNGAFADGEPVIYDPATYYGDREADLAMTELFGGFSGDFYQGYKEAWPLDAGYERRRVIYNWYHIANHYVLFGGGYMQQAQGMLRTIKSFKK